MKKNPENERNPRYKIRNDDNSYCYFKGKCADSALHIFAFKIKEKIKRDKSYFAISNEKADSALLFLLKLRREEIKVSS